MLKRIMLLFLCFGVLSTVTGCYLESSPYGLSSPGEYGSERYGVGAYQGEPYRDYEGRTRAPASLWDRQQGNPHTPVVGGNSQGP